ncbi:hypothetical protein CesoFtcFv8_021404 [Champsocephalus esox]|uniref:Uncharacterized protein n=2 Tax=Champsocephalus TaxID=52236 RepID=A0AAN8HAX8_CHAGU|nr:hypothetical protein CesoFtcFv8_021404 [Champsocephalus esox]KAK5908916.1 hypothetical protein CgunFtcFv8_016934 [Champsocephalus gunnari]
MCILVKQHCSSGTPWKNTARVSSPREPGCEAPEDRCVWGDSAGLQRAQSRRGGADHGEVKGGSRSSVHGLMLTSRGQTSGCLPPGTRLLSPALVLQEMRRTRQISGRLQL